MDSPRRFTSRFRFNTLRWRLSISLTALFAAMGILAWFGIESQAQLQRQAVLEAVDDTARAFTTISWRNTESSHTEVEHFLLLATRHPVQRIAIVDHNGRARLTAERPVNGETYLHNDALQLTPPQDNNTRLIVSPINASYWQPLTRNGQAGEWLMIDADLTHVARWRTRLSASALLWYVALYALTLSTSIWLARNSDRAIGESARFAEGISGETQAELTLDSGNPELQRLQTALNRLAQHWQHRQHLNEQAMTTLRTHKMAIDAHAAVCITDGAGRIEYVNRHFCALSGYDNQELVGKNIGLLNSGRHDDFYFKNLWRTLALGRIWQGTLCNRHKRGEIYWMHCTIAPIMDHTGRPCQYLAVQTLTAQQSLDNVASAG